MNINIEDNKILPVTYPPITSYPHHANLLSILSYNANNLIWFYNYYFQLAINKSMDNRLDFNIGYSIIPFLKNCPLITYNGISRALIEKKWSKIVEFLIDSIRCGYYIYLIVDKYFISSYEESYMTYHSHHDLMIFGYDVKNQTFHIADFFKNSKYYYTTATFSEIEQGYNESNRSDWIGSVILLKENKSYQPKFDITILKNYINDYIESKNSNTRTILINTWLNDNDYAFGLQVYPILEQHLKMIQKNGFFDIRPYHILWDHKKIVLSILEFLHKKGYLIKSDYFYNEFVLLERKCLILRNVLLKYKVSNNKILIDRVVILLREIYKKEKYLLKNLIHNINYCPLLYIPSNVEIKYSSLSIKYSDGWIEDKSGDEKNYWTDIKNAFASFMFYGTYISFLAIKNKDCGYIRLYIDEKEAVLIDLYSESEKYNDIVYINNALLLGYHTIKIVCLGEHNKRSNGCYVNINMFKISTEKYGKAVSNCAKFYAIERSPKDEWVNIYGKDGYEIIGCTPNYPSYADIRYKNAEYYRFPNTEKDQRALLNPNNFSDRIVAIMCNHDSFEVQMCISGNTEKIVTFYLIDYDYHDRETYIKAVDFDNKQFLSAYNIKDFKEGIYISFLIKGRVDFIFKNISKNMKLFQNTVLSGVFFDDF